MRYSENGRSVTGDCKYGHHEHCQPLGLGLKYACECSCHATTAKKGGKKVTTRQKCMTAAAVLFGIPAYVMGFNGGLALLNQPNDGLVWLGYCLLVVLIALACGIAMAVARKAKAIFPTLAVAALAVVLNGCAYTTVEPGHVGIKIEQTGSQRGVQDFPVKTGRVFYNPINEYVLEYPTNVQQYTWTHETGEGKPLNEEVCFKSAESLIFCADVNAAFRVIDEKAPQFYVKFRNDDINAFVHGFFRNVLRDSFTKHASNYTTDDLNGSKQQALLETVTTETKAELLGYGVELIKLGFAHPPRPPAQIQEAITAKLKAVQDGVRIQNELASTQAEAKKVIAKYEGEAQAVIAQAKGKAEANRIEQQSITPQLLQMRAVEKWDGRLPTVQAAGSSTILDLNGIRGK